MPVIQEAEESTKVLVEKFERKCPHGRRENRAEDDIKGDKKGKDRRGWTGFVWFRYRQLAGSGNTVIDFRLP